MFTINRLTGVFGAELQLDLSGGWDQGTVSSIRDALRDHKVLVLRGNTALTPEQLSRFAAEFGVPETREHPFWDHHPSLPDVKVIRTDGDVNLTKRGPKRSTKGDGLHTDGSVRSDTHEWISFLHAHQIPPYGRDTLFADMEAAYEYLSSELKRFLDRLSAVHRFPTLPDGAKDYEPVVHPVVLRDPETDRRALYVNKAYTAEICGLHPNESKAILEFLFEQSHRPEVQLRVAWKPGDLTIWDNRRTQHCAVMDLPGERVMHRVMVALNRLDLAHDQVLAVAEQPHDM